MDVRRATRMFLKYLGSRDSDRLQARRPGFESRYGRDFLFSTASGPALRPIQSPIKWVAGALFPWVKRLGRDTDHSPPSGAEDKKGGAIFPPP
jgi:hypothetical protein